MISRTDTTISLEQSPSTLFIEASNDEIIPPKTMEELSKKIKNSQYIGYKPTNGFFSLCDLKIA